jgi:predicted dehydrogenase
MKEIRIGLLGFGTIGRLHTLAYRSLPLSTKDPQVMPRLVALLRSLRSQPAGGTATAAASGFEVVTTDPDEFYACRPEVVDICTPNHLHFAQARLALEAGAAVYCEKPLGVNLAEAQTLADLAESRRAITQVAFTTRFSPAIRQMKRLLEAGALGEVLHFRAYKLHASYLDPTRPMSWRLRFSESGGGAFQDLGIHLADLVRYLLGEPQRLRAETRILFLKRPASLSSSYLEPVDVDDWAHCLLELPGGACGSIEVSRLAAGTGESTGLEIYGSRGALVFDSHRPETASFYDQRQKQWLASDILPEPNAGERPSAVLWPEKKFTQGDMLNRHLASIYNFLLCVAEGVPSMVDFRAAAQAQEIVEAVYRSANQNGAWIEFPLAST